MTQKTKVLTVRVDSEIYDLIKKNGGNNVSGYTKNLIYKGLMCELDEMFQRANNIPVDSGEDLSQNNIKKIVTSLDFLQELSVRIAIKQGYKPEDIKMFYQASKEKTGG